MLLAVLALSTSVIFIKASTTHPVLIAAIRLTLATLLLTPLEQRDKRRFATILAETRHLPTRPWIAGVILALHFISWNYGARMTDAAQASLIVNLVPVAVPFFLWFLVREGINRREIIGTVVTLIGVLLLTLNDVLAATGSAPGNVVCFVSMLLFACYLALGRRFRHLPSLWLYVVPVYRTAALTCALISIPLLPTGMHWTSPIEWGYLFALAIVPTIIGHSLLNGAMRHFRGQVVSLANCGQFVAAGVLAWLIFAEVPTPIFYAASAIVVAGIAIVIRPVRSPVRTP